MWTTFVFDVEDYVTPPEGGLDDLLKMLADVMTEQGVSGTFFLIGEKLRCLRDRGRRDVIESVARHDMGSHINMGSIHPTVTERMERANWSDGLARMAADELAGIDELGEIAGREITSLARHGGSFAPQLLAALATHKLPYVYSPAKLPGHHVTWYCNTLNFYNASQVFQEAYHSRETFLEAEKKYFALLEDHAAYDWVGMFQSHPCHIKTQTFWDKNYFKGRNPAPDAWQVPPCYAEYSIERVRENWAFHCGRVRENPDLRLRTIAELAQIFGAQADSANAAEIRDLAQRAADEDAPFFTDRFSAAEILDLLARACLYRRNEGTLPERLERRQVFGPTQTPLSVPTAKSLNAEALMRVARGVVRGVDVSGCIPSRIRCGEGTVGSFGEIGAGSAMKALGTALDSDDVRVSLDTSPAAPYPAEAGDVSAEARQFKRWGPHRADLDMADICRLTELQSWTLKPAWPEGPPDFQA